MSESRRLDKSVPNTGLGVEPVEPRDPGIGGLFNSSLIFLQ